MPLTGNLKKLFDGFTPSDLDQLAEKAKRTAEELELSAMPIEDLEKILDFVTDQVARVNNEIFGFLVITHAVCVEQRRRAVELASRAVRS